MNEIKNQVFQLLNADNTLLAMLAINADPYEPDNAPSKSNSVAGAEIVDQLKPPFLILRADTVTKTGRTHMREALILVRCYNSKDKTYFTINSALSRVQQLIDNSLFQVAGYGEAEATWEITREESLDEGIGMNYREAQFRIQLN